MLETLPHGCLEQPPAPTDSAGIAETVSSSLSSELENAEDPLAQPSESGAGASSLVLNKRTWFLHMVLEDGKLVSGKPFPFVSCTPRTSAKRHADAQNVSDSGVVCSLAGGLAHLVAVSAEVGTADFGAFRRCAPTTVADVS